MTTRHRFEDPRVGTQRVPYWSDTRILANPNGTARIQLPQETRPGVRLAVLGVERSSMRYSVFANVLCFDAIEGSPAI